MKPGNMEKNREKAPVFSAQIMGFITNRLTLHGLHILVIFAHTQKKPIKMKLSWAIVCINEFQVL